VKNELREIQEVEEVKEKTVNPSRVAAFFDLDGTLLAQPSMERRFFSILRSRGEISWRNCLLWLKEAARLAPRGIQEMLQTNKMYLRGVREIAEWDAEASEIFPARTSGHQGMGQEPTSVGGVPGFSRRDPRLPVPVFFPEGVARVAWHAREEHAIVLLSGTLEPLAKEVARELEAELATRGVVTAIRTCATWLEAKNGRWTGRISGEAMFGEEKARAIRRVAVAMNLDLARCFAYGDSAVDAPMLQAVGNAFAANPSKELGRIAEERGWPAVQWNEEKRSTQRAQSAQSTQSEAGNRRAIEEAASGSFR